jgi:hypothetical protein
MDAALDSHFDLDGRDSYSPAKIRLCVDSLAPARLALSGLPKKGSLPRGLPTACGAPSVFGASSSRLV